MSWSIIGSTICWVFQMEQNEHIILHSISIFGEWRRENTAVYMVERQRVDVEGGEEIRREIKREVYNLISWYGAF